MKAIRQLSILQQSVMHRERFEQGVSRRKTSYRMLLLLYFLLSPVLELPFYDVSLWRGTLDMLALSKLSPKVVEVLNFN